MPLPVTVQIKAGVPFEPGDTYSTPFGSVTITQQLLDSGLLNGQFKTLASHQITVQDQDVNEADLQTQLEVANAALANALSASN